jgi:hypothetical protein
MIDHPYIDFTGDGHSDAYTTAVEPSGAHAFYHYDCHGHIDAIAYDFNHDGRIDAMDVDSNHNGTLDRHLEDVNGDGIMDTSSSTGGPYLAPLHPHIDFNGDGRADSYRTETENGTQAYVHDDGHGHVTATAFDFNHDGLIDEMFVDDNHDGIFDRVLTDTNGDGIMDTSQSL